MICSDILNLAAAYDTFQTCCIPSATYQSFGGGRTSRILAAQRLLSFRPLNTVADVAKHVAANLNVKYRFAGSPVCCPFEMLRLEETVVHRTSLAGPLSLDLRPYMDTTPSVASPRLPRRVERFRRIHEGAGLTGDILQDLR